LTQYNIFKPYKKLRLSDYGIDSLKVSCVIIIIAYSGVAESYATYVRNPQIATTRAYCYFEALFYSSSIGLAEVIDLVAWLWNRNMLWDEI